MAKKKRTRRVAPSDPEFTREMRNEVERLRLRGIRWSAIHEELQNKFDGYGVPNPAALAGRFRRWAQQKGEGGRGEPGRGEASELLFDIDSVVSSEVGEMFSVDKGNSYLVALTGPGVAYLQKVPGAVAGRVLAAVVWPRRTK